MKIIAIFAYTIVDGEYVIGADGDMPWPRHKEDMKRFRSLTVGQTVFMGRKTFDSLGRKPLKDRLNLVLSNSEWPDKVEQAERGVLQVRSISEALNEAQRGVDFCVIGGAEVYQQTASICSDFYGTEFFLTEEQKDKIRSAKSIVSVEPFWESHRFAYNEDHGDYQFFHTSKTL